MILRWPGQRPPPTRSTRSPSPRRQVLDVLAGGERPVNDLVRELGLAQPQVSKHLRVLREVGAVDVVLEDLKRKESGDGSDE
jgi:DNA-binding transcriptional ArsR family regulator